MAREPDEQRNGGRAPGGERHLPVLARPRPGAAPEVVEVEARPLARPVGDQLPSPALAAAGGFLAGFATLVLARLLRRGTVVGVRVGRRRRRALEREVALSRSFLVDVHVLRR